MTHHLPPASHATACGVDSRWNDEVDWIVTWGSNEEMEDGTTVMDNNGGGGEVTMMTGGQGHVSRGQKGGHPHP